MPHFHGVCQRRNMSCEDCLKHVYYDPGNVVSFLRPDKMYWCVRKQGKHVRSKYKIRKLLQRQEAYSLQRSVRKCFKINKRHRTWHWWSMERSIAYFQIRQTKQWSCLCLGCYGFTLYVSIDASSSEQKRSNCHFSLWKKSSGRSTSYTNSYRHGTRISIPSFQYVFNNQNIQHLYTQNAKVKAKYAESVILIRKMSKRHWFIAYRQK